MTPKKYAEELIMEMYAVHSSSASDITLHFAKQCALVAVNRILELLPEIAFGNRVIEFYEQVKQEIENYGGNK
jgi:hypothetical protein